MILLDTNICFTSSIPNRLKCWRVFINTENTMIAAHALSVNAVLVTNNTCEFSKVRGLQLENWAASA